MAVTVTPYDRFLGIQARGAGSQIDLVAATIKLMLVDATYTPDKANDETLADVVGEISGGGYTAGGMALASKAFVFYSAGSFWYWDADNVTWSPLTNTFRRGILWGDLGAGDNILIAWVDFQFPQSPAGIPFTVEWAPPELGGILKWIGSAT